MFRRVAVNHTVGLEAGPTGAGGAGVGHLRIGIDACGRCGSALVLENVAAFGAHGAAAQVAAGKEALVEEGGGAVAAGGDRPVMTDELDGPGVAGEKKKGDDLRWEYHAECVA
jgi:hypothetical protein